MKRSIVLHESRTCADGWLLWLVFVLGALLLALALATTAAAGTAYYSFEGAFTDGTERQSFLFNTDAAISSPETFSLRTWHFASGINAAGESIPGGGFNPILRLYSGETLAAVDDDIDRSVSNYDAELTWRSADYAPPEIALRDPFRTGDYRLELRALSGGGTHWAVDLVGPADKMTLTGVDKINNSGATTIDSLSIGTDSADSTPAELRLGTFQSLTVADSLIVGKTGYAAVNVTTGSLTSGYGILGFGPASVGSLTLASGGSWLVTGTNFSFVGFADGEGNFRIESGGSGLFLGDLYLGYSSEGNVTVTGNDSILTVNGDLMVGSVDVEGVGYLRIEDRGKVNSSGVGLLGDTVGLWNTSQGIVEVDGQDSRWSTNTLTVGSEARGTLRITGGGKIETTGNAYIGRYTSGHDSSVTLTGNAPDGTPSTWQVSGNLYIAGNESGASTAANSKLTINPGGFVDVAGTTTVWNGGGILELLGGEMETGSLFVKPGATFTHTDGTLTVNGGTFHVDVGNNKIDGADAADLPVVKLINEAIASVSTSFIGYVIVGDDYRGRLEILSGSRAELSGGLVIGQMDSSNGEVIVDGRGSRLTSFGPAVGYFGRGVLRIRDGGTVIDTVAFEYESIGQFGGSVGIVEVAGTALDGTPSTWTPRSQLRVGDSGHGTLTISTGGQVNAVAGAAIATYSSAGGSSATVTGLNSRWAITGPLYVGGNEATGGGAGTLTVANNGQVTASSVKVWQPGTVELNNNNGIISTGSLELAGGKLQGIGTVLVSGQLANAGVISPGVLAPALSTDLIIVDGDYTQNLAGELDIEIGGTAPSDYDRLFIENGSALLHGKLAVSLIDTGGGAEVFQPSAGDMFEILVASGGLGGTTFATEMLPALRGGLYFGVLYNPNDVTLVAAGVWGDYNRNGAVDAADYVVWRKTFSGPNVPATSLAADGDGDRDVDQGDFIVWRSHFGQTAGSGSGANANAAVPEPATAVMLIVGILAMCCRRRAVVS